MQTISEILKQTPETKTLAHEIIGEHRIIAYGHGQGFVTFNEFVIKKCGLSVDTIIDEKFSEPSVWQGIKTTNLNSIDCSHVFGSIVIITVGNKFAQEKIKIALKKKGFTRIILAFDIYEYHLSHTEVEVIYAGNDYYCEYQKEIQQVYGFLRDAESKQVFRDLLNLYVSRQIKPIKCRPIKEQYLSDDIPFKWGYTDLVNCGAFDGDTIKNISDRVGRLNSVVCLEPDLLNFSKLTDYLSQNKDKIATDIIALPLGVGASTQYVRFAQAGTNSSVLSTRPLPHTLTPLNTRTYIHTSNYKEGQDSAESMSQNSAVNQPKLAKKQLGSDLDSPSAENIAFNQILSARVDEILISRSISFINMDVEGAEVDGLKGLRRVITTKKPDLGISIYHHPAHLWIIPLLIYSFSSDYVFYLRNYTGYPAETVLYACLK